MDVGRPKWTPETEDQRRAIAAAKLAATRADKADEVMWRAVQVALDLNVPAAFMAETVGRGRATLYRHATPPGSNSQATETDEEN